MGLDLEMLHDTVRIMGNSKLVGGKNAEYRMMISSQQYEALQQPGSGRLVD